MRIELEKAERRNGAWRMRPSRFSPGPATYARNMIAAEVRKWTNMAHAAGVKAPAAMTASR
jgi:hypothetical protein